MRTALSTDYANGKAEVLSYTHLETPIGPLLIAGDHESLHRISFPKQGCAIAPDAGWAASTRGAVGEAMNQLREYFAGKRQEFNLPLAPEGTPFQRSVWQGLLEIPYGATISYATLAANIGKPKACRAVAAANGANLLPIVIPCHRVIAAGGKLGGFGGGLSVKQTLLDLEARFKHPRLF
jgi:methylated-DNA-[protein]-cysteine S-methyltransferase